MSYCDIETPEFYAEDFPVARKVHRCCECSAPINVGEKHLYVRAKQDGEFWRERQHMLCRELCMHIRDELGECICFGGLKEEWQDGDWNFGPKAEKRKARTLYARILKRERAAERAARSTGESASDKENA